MVIRKSFFAGSWYPHSHEGLTNLLDRCFTNKEFGPGEMPKCLNLNKRTIIGGVSPHAGIEISGSCAAFTFLHLFKEKIPDVLIVIGFFHRGIGPNSVLKEGEWETPLGNVKIDNELAEKLLAISKIIVSNDSVFLDIEENSLELLVPFIKYCSGDKEVKILPIKIFSHNFKELEQIASDIVELMNSSSKDIVVVVSSDMSHYNVYNNEQLKTLREIDQIEIDQFLKLEPEKFLKPESYVNQELYDKFEMGERRPSVCGRHAIATLLTIGQKLNINKAKCLKSYNSKDISPGGHPWTVGYFSGILIK